MPTLPSSRLLIMAAASALLAAAAIFTVDSPVSRVCLAGELPGDVEKGINLSEAFAHGVGVAFICLSFYVLDSRRHLLPRLIALPVITGLTANVAKLLVERKRPHQFAAMELPVAGDTFLGFPGSFGDSTVQSFPSGHTATAVGLAIALTRLYPKGTPLFATLAVLAASQRIVSGSHFVSDTLAGAAVAFLIAAFTVDRLFWDALGPTSTR